MVKKRKNERLGNFPKKVLVTGATGFVGSHLIARMIKDKWDVHIIIRDLSELKSIEQYVGKIKYHIHDGSTEGLVHIVKRAKPAFVIHLASLFLARHEVKDIIPLIKSNIIFGTQLLEAMAQNEVKYLINTGTSWQHYHDQKYDPVCLYAATKQAFEDIIKYYVEANSFKVITLKLFDTYGPGDPRPKLFNLLKSTVKSGRLLKMSPGQQKIDLVYIDDVIEAYMIAAKRIIKNKEKNSDYAIASSKPVTIKKLISIFEKIVGVKLNVRFGARPYRHREVMRPWGKGRRLPGWEPKTNIYDGIRKILLGSNA